MRHAKRGIIICHGDFNPGNFEFQPEDLLICADGGAEYAASMGWTPSIVIGDLDSISQKTRDAWTAQGVEFRIFPKEKDKTDGELALDYALSFNLSDIVILGAMGGRVDHSLTNIFMVANVPAGKRVRILDKNQELWITRDRAEVEGQIGDQVSLLALSGEVTGVDTAGLYYPLHKGTLRFGSSLGNSNELTTPKAVVSIESGVLLIVHTRAE